MQHSEVQVQAIYNRTIEQFVGKSDLSKMVEVLRVTIKRGNFEKLVKQRLSTEEAFDDTSINHTWPIPEDPDPVNQARREVQYEMSRQLLLRAAKLKAHGMH